MRFKSALVFGFFATTTSLQSFPEMAFAAEHGLKVGAKAPEISTKDINGKPYQLSSELKRGPVVLVFYRGGWCPHCNTQLRSLEQKVIPKLAAYKASMVAISVDLPQEGLKTASATNLKIPIISDPKAEILGDYNVKYKVPEELVHKYKASYQIDLEKSSGEKHHIIAIPAVFVISEDGKVTFSYANEDYKIRAAENDILKALSKTK